MSNTPQEIMKKYVIKHWEKVMVGIPHHLQKSYWNCEQLGVSCEPLKMVTEH
jgi:hypothetical protein